MAGTADREGQVATGTSEPGRYCTTRLYRYLFVSSIECELNQFKLSSRHPFIVAGMGSLQLQRLVRVSVLYQTL